MRIEKEEFATQPRGAMNLEKGFRCLRQLLLVLVFHPVFFAILVADLVQSDSVEAPCGELQSIGGEINILPGQEVKSCNGRFALTYQDDGKVVFMHLESQTVLWHQPANQGSAYAFYRQENPELGITALLPPSAEYSGMNAIAAVPSTAVDSNSDAKIALASTDDNSDLNPTLPDEDALGIDASSSKDADATPTLTLSKRIETDDTMTAPNSTTLSPNSKVNGSPTSSKSDLLSNAVALAPSSSLFLNPPSDSYFTKRIEIKKREGVLPDANGIRHVKSKLKFHEDGTLTIEEDGPDPKTIWSSDTGGAHCGTLYIPEKGKTQVLNSLASDTSHEGIYLRQLIQVDPCKLKDVYITQAGGKTKMLKAAQEPSGSGSGSDSGSGVSPRSVLSDRALHGRTIVNEFQFFLTMNPANPTAFRIPIGTARLQKTFYYNGVNVSNAPGDSSPERAIILGEATDLAQLIGFLFGYFNPGSDQEIWSNWGDPEKGIPESGRGAHVSSRVTRMNFESLPFLPLGGYVLVKFAWHQELFIRVMGDSSIECRGGQHCSEGNLP